jgi:hypothetical protein
VPASASQPLPQLPQLAALEYWTQAPLQKLYPGSHTNPQVPSVQVVWAFGSSVAHAFPQLPQLSTLARLTHPPSQDARPASHTGSFASSVGPASPDSASAAASVTAVVVESPPS